MSRRRSADHARVKRIIDAMKALEGREPKHTKSPPLQPLQVAATPLQVASQLPGPVIIPNLQTPTSSATPPSPTSGSGGSGSGNGGGNISGQGGDAGNSGGNGSGGGGSSGNGGGSGSGGGDTGTTPTNSGGANLGSGGGSSISPTSTPAPGPAGATDASPTGDTTGSSLPGVANPGSGSSTTLFIQGSVPSTSRNGVPVAMSTQGRSSVAAGTVNSGGGNNSTDSQSMSTLSRSHGLSSGGIAGIVITLLIVGLAALVVMLRRRAIARRVKRREQWFGQGIASTAPHGDNGSSRFGSIASRKAGTAAGTRSARSSFGTTFDQSPHNPNFDGLLPPMPPMAEIRGEGPFILGLDLNSYTMNTNSKRNSAGSKNSTASDPNAQYLFLPPISQGNGAIGSPMSVRPFSPSELYSFPKPPSETNRESEDRVSASSQLPNNGHSGQVDHVRLSDAAEHPSVVEEVNPFADPIAATVATQPAVEEIEVIRRPFMPTLQDELIVAAGDRVRILQTFDDGWTLVQKIPPPVDKKGKAKAVDEFDQGLIPIECLRGADQDRPDFIAQKRVSSAEDLDVNIARAL
jgi:hypothetical protein